MPRRPRRAASQPHDSLVKFAFSRREHAAGLLKAVLHPKLGEAVAWDTLVLENRRFVSPALRGRHIDLLFSARLAGEEVHFYFLVEQQRHVEKLMVLRMGSYLFDAWNDLVKDRPTLDRVPPILPILIHHSPTGWTAATAFPDIVAVPEAFRPLLAPHVPSFEMAVVDVSPGRASRIVEGMLTGLGKMVLFCLSVAGDDERLAAGMARMAGAFEAMLAGKDGVDALHAVLRYLLATHRRLSPPRIVRLLEAATSDARKKVIMDELDVFRVEGREEGRREGHLEGRKAGRVEGTAQTLLRQLQARFGEVPADTRARVLAASPATLARWSLQVLTAPTLESALEGKKAAPARRQTTRARARRKIS
jgi:predicted transposase YdaD